MLTDQVAYFTGTVPTMTKFSICYWEFSEYFNLKGNYPVSYCFKIYKDQGVIHCLAPSSQRNRDSMGSKASVIKRIHLKPELEFPPCPNPNPSPESQISRG